MSSDESTKEQIQKPDQKRETPAHIPWIRPDLVRERKREPYFETSDLVIIALFSGLGGIFSTYIGYLANLLNSIFGIPFGGGQFLAGLHIFWLVFIYLLTDRKVGVTFTSGVLKGFVEFFAGNAHGLLVVLISSTQGFVIELILIVFLSTKRKSIIAAAAGIAGLSNVVLQQVLFFNSQIPISFIALIGVMSFISGCILGGVFPLSVYYVFNQSTALKWRKPRSLSPRYRRNIKVIRGMIIAILLFAEVSIVVLLMTQNRYSIEITGEVYNPYTFYIDDFPQVTIEAQLVGDVTVEPPQNYTGVPVYQILQRAQPKIELYKITLRAPDGYSVTFNSTEIDHNEYIMISSSNRGLRIVAADYPGNYWIYYIATISVQRLS